MHDVHAFTRLGEPFTTARTRWMFGFHRRLVRRCEWLSFMPKIGFLPHTSQTEDIENTSEQVDQNAERLAVRSHPPRLGPECRPSPSSQPPICAKPFCDSATPSARTRTNSTA